MPMEAVARYLGHDGTGTSERMQGHITERIYKREGSPQIQTSF